MKNKDIDVLIYEAAKKAGFTPNAARLVVAQARHETGNYTSKVFREYNNAFGMRPAVIRKTTRKKEVSPSNYAIYERITDSVEDLGLWFKARSVSKAFDTVVAYASAIQKKGYFEASLTEYVNGMSRALSKIEI